MKKFGILAAFCAIVLAIPATAIALNEYTLTASFSPSKAGSVSNPSPAGTHLGFAVSDTENKRPLALEKFGIRIAGSVFNGGLFPKCTATQITRAQSDAGCRGSLVATGYARNIAGNRQDRNDKSLTCYLNLRLHNSGRGKMALFVTGNPNAPAGRTCPIRLAVAIPISISVANGSSTLNLTIPESLKHPLPTLTNGLVRMDLELPRRTVTRSGQRRGFLELRGKCVGGRRPVSFTFTNEPTEGTTSANIVRQTQRARCS